MATISAQLSPVERLAEMILQRTATVAVIGLGYVGLPLAEAIAAAGHTVYGYDIDEKKVSSLARGESYIRHISSDRIQAMVAGGQFSATNDSRVLQDADVIVICVPTPLVRGHEPDLSYVAATGKMLARRLRRGQLVVLESTTYPGTTEELLQPILEQSGLRGGQDFYLAFSPEREDPGNQKFGTRDIPRVVGGIDTNSTELACAFYQNVVRRVVPVGGSRVAEACKILENTYRAVNIALVNELKLVFDAMNIDIWEVIEAAKTKPFGFQPFYPGPGLGGHCIPIDPFYLTWAARRVGVHTKLIELAGEINTRMPRFVVQRVVQALTAHGKALRGSRVLLLGVAYKKDIDDTRESPAFAIAEALEEQGAIVAYHDPYVPYMSSEAHPTEGIASQPLTRELLQAQECVIVVTDHAEIDYPFVIANSRLIVDTRNVTAGFTDTACQVFKA